MKKVLSIILALSFLFTIGASAADTTAAAAQPQALELKAKSAILVEASTGKVLFEKNSHERLAPASITKIMTMILIMEALDSGRIKLTDLVTCSEYAAGMGGSQVYLEAGEEMSVSDLLKAIAVASGNDASVAIAEFIAGSNTAFIAMMNQKAKDLKMNDTNFINCTGLEEENHYTSAYDVALMSCELLKHPKVLEYTSIWLDSLRGGKFGLANTNKLVRFYKGANGLKTGSTDKALYCVSASAVRNNMSLVSVALASPTSANRFSDASKILDYGFANWAIANTDNEEIIEPVKVIKGVMPSVGVQVSGDTHIVVEKGKEQLVKKSINMQEDVLAPVDKGQTLGDIVYTLDGNEVGRVPIKAVDSVAKAGFGYFLQKLAKVLYA